MSELEDIKLKAFLQNMKLDSPEPNFSVRVMNKIFEEEGVLGKIKKERVLGKGFWIISILFIALLAVMFVMNYTGIQPESQLAEVFPDAQSSQVVDSYNSFLSRIGTLPLSIAGILIASSVLLFIDRFISSNSKIFA